MSLCHLGKRFWLHVTLRSTSERSPAECSLKKNLQDDRWKWGYEIKIKTFITVIYFSASKCLLASSFNLILWRGEKEVQSHRLNYVNKTQCLYTPRHPQTGRETGIYFAPRTPHWTAASSPVEHNISTKRLTHFRHIPVVREYLSQELSQPQISAECVHVKGSVFMLTYLCC